MPKKQRVNKENLIQVLEYVQPGLATREIIDQSSCFVFKDRQVMTYNQELACRADCPLDIEGAVQSAPLLALLHRLPEEEIQVIPKDKHLKIIGKRRKAGIRMEQEVLLPYDEVERPKKWQDLPAQFLEAVKMAYQCVGKDESMFATTCIHITPKWIEASDSFQITRYKLKLGVSESIMVRGQSLKQVADLGVTQFSETPNWIHFRNGTELTLSCRRHLEDYIDLTEHLKVEDPTDLVLPKGLSEACETAGIFSAENATEENLISVTLGENQLQIYGTGTLGWYREDKRINYDGPSLSFMVSPNILAEIVQRMNECQITSKKLRVTGERWVYVSCLTPKEETKEDEDDESSTDGEGGE